MAKKKKDGRKNNGGHSTAGAKKRLPEDKKQHVPLYISMNTLNMEGAKEVIFEKVSKVVKAKYEKSLIII